MAIYKLKTDLRENLKRGYTRKLRNEGMVPGIYYYHKEEPKAIAIDQQELLDAIKTNAHIFELDLGKDKLQTVIKTIQWHPVTDEPIHIDFQGVSEDEPVELSIKVETEGLAVGVKEHGGLLSQSVWHLNVRCMISDIPEIIKVDVTNLGMGDSIAVKDLEYENVEFLDSPEKSIVSVITPKGLDAILEEQEEALAEEEVAVEGEEGEEGAETEEGEETEEEKEE